MLGSIEIMLVKELTDFEDIARRTGGTYRTYKEDGVLRINYPEGHIYVGVSPLWVRDCVNQASQALFLRYHSLDFDISNYAAVLTQESLIVIDPTDYSRGEDYLFGYTFGRGSISDREILIPNNLLEDLLRGLRDLARGSTHIGPRPVPSPF